MLFNGVIHIKTLNSNDDAFIGESHSVFILFLLPWNFAVLCILISINDEFCKITNKLSYWFVEDRLHFVAV